MDSQQVGPHAVLCWLVAAAAAVPVPAQLWALSDAMVFLARSARADDVLADFARPFSAGPPSADARVRESVHTLVTCGSLRPVGVDLLARYEVNPNREPASAGLGLTASDQTLIDAAGQRFAESVTILSKNLADSEEHRSRAS